MARPSSVRLHLPQLKRQAKELRRAVQAGEASALVRAQTHLPHLKEATDPTQGQASFSLRASQQVIAREQGFADWAMLNRQVAANRAEVSPVVPPTKEPPMNAQQITEFFFSKGCVDGDEEDLQTAIKRDTRKLTPDEVEFIRAAATPTTDRWTGVCDVDRMAELVEQAPVLLESLGPLLLRVTVATRGCADATKFLLDHGVPLLIAETSYNALHEAGWAGCTDNLRHVFESGAADATLVGLIKPHDGWPDNYSLMYWAAWGGHVDMAKLLLEHGARVHHELPLQGNAFRGNTVLQEAVAPGPWAPDHAFRSSPGKGQVARLLIKEGAYFDVYSASGLNNKRRLSKLLAEDAGLADQRDDDRMTPLHWAARAGAAACTAALLEQGAEIEAVDRAKNTPLHLAASNGQAPVIELFIEHGADLDFPDRSGRTALHLATYNGHLATAEALIGGGASTKIKNRKGKTPLEVARMDCRPLKPQLA
ncbi:MAG: hypothetical protein GKR89_36370 [Candidatus Latescibacteria bacterium]|nr:hypothetical protein [Candidatus Latescibacterota bacterium]